MKIKMKAGQEVDDFLNDDRINNKIIIHTDAPVFAKDTFITISDKDEHEAYKKDMFKTLNKILCDECWLSVEKYIKENEWKIKKKGDVTE